MSYDVSVSEPRSRVDQAWAHHPDKHHPMHELDMAALLVRFNTALALLGHPRPADLETILAAQEKLPPYLAALEEATRAGVNDPLVRVRYLAGDHVLQVIRDHVDEDGRKERYQLSAFLGTPALLVFPTLLLEGDADKIPTTGLGAALVMLGWLVDLVPSAGGVFEAGLRELAAFAPQHELESLRNGFEYTMAYDLRAGDAGSWWMTYENLSQ